jgi:NADH-quinone oxidoreductase subunit M
MVLMGTFEAARPGSAVLSSGAGSAATVLTLAVLACVGVVLSAGYNLWMLQRVFLGKPRPEHGDLPEVTRREVAVLTPLAAMCVLLGVLPAVFVFAFTDRTVAALMQILR